MLSGWSIGGEGGRFRGGVPGQFLFRPELHEPGAKVVLGTRYRDDGFGQGVAVLRDWRARAPPPSSSPPSWRATSSPTSRRRRRSRASRDAFHSSGGDLPRVYHALLDAREAWDSGLAKYKSPCDYVLSAYRGLGLPADAAHAPLAPFELLGQRTWSPGSPAGWPDRSADWDGAAALMKRIQWAQALGERLGGRCDAVALAPELLGANLGAATRARARARGQRRPGGDAAAGRARIHAALRPPGASR